jgi:hypothetical protein
MSFMTDKLRRIERLTEAIQSGKRRVSALESERAKVREEIELAYAEAADAARPASVTELANQLDMQLHLSEQNPKPRRIARPKIPKSLIEAAEHVATLEGPVDAKRLADAMGITFDGARLRLARAAKHGLVRRVKTGEYEANMTPEPKNDHEDRDTNYWTSAIAEANKT